MSLHIVIIHDQLKVRELLTGLLEAWKLHEVDISSSGYTNRSPSLMKKWLNETDLFILGLERHYPQGRCTEGVQTAEMLWRFGKRALIVGTECQAKLIKSTNYWDLDSTKSFLQAIESTLNSAIPDNQEISLVREYFQHRTTKPVGHGKP